MVSVDQAYMVGHMKNADGSINNKNVVLSAACEEAELLFRLPHRNFSKAVKLFTMA